MGLTAYHLMSEMISGLHLKGDRFARAACGITCCFFVLGG